MRRVAFTSDERLCNGSLVEHAWEFYVCEYERWAPKDTVFLIEEEQKRTANELTAAFRYIGAKHIGR